MPIYYSSSRCNFWPLVVSSKAAFMLILRRLESAFWNADVKTPIQTSPLIQAIVRAQVNRKGVYMTSFKRGYNVTFAFMLPPESAFCSNHDRITHIFGLRSCLFCEGVLKRWFKTPIQNAVHGSTVHASLEQEDDTFTEAHGMSRNSSDYAFFSGYCSSSSDTGKAFIWRHLNVVIHRWFCVHASTRISVLL